MPNYFKKKSYAFVVSILLLAGCEKEPVTPIAPTPNYVLQKMESISRSFNFQYNDISRIKLLNLIDKNSGLSTNFQYLYNTSGILTEVSVGYVKYNFEYDSPNSFTVITTRLPDEKLFKDNFLLESNKIKQHTHHVWENNEWKPEGKYNYSYYADGNLHRIELYSTTWNNQWYIYGSYWFKTYDTFKNNFAAIDFATSFMNFQLPIVIDKFKNSFVNNPLLVQSFDSNGNLLLTYAYEYKHAKNLRVNRIQKDYLSNQIISTDTLRYFYKQ